MAAPTRPISMSDDAPCRTTLSEIARGSTALEELVSSVIRPGLEAYLRPRLTSLENQNGILSDLVGDALLSVIERLQREDEEPVQNVASYTRQVAQAKLDDHLRKAKPHYWSVQGSVRYICSKDASIMLSWLNGVEVVNLASSTAKAPNARRMERLAGIQADFAGLQRLIGPCSRDDRAEILHRVLRWSKAPVPLDLVVRTICLAQDPSDYRIQPPGAVEPKDVSPSPHVLVSLRAEIQQLWKEVLELPPRQRMALLLNLRGERGENVVLLLPLARVASLQDIAAALEIPVGRLAEIWTDLPLSDEMIATMLGVTIHQVSNLRGAARARLKRRMETAGYP